MEFGLPLNDGVSLCLGDISRVSNVSSVPFLLKVMYRVCCTGGWVVICAILELCSNLKQDHEHYEEL